MWAYPTVGSYKVRLLESVANWYKIKVEKVEEMRTLTPFQTEWLGHWYSIDKNYNYFDKWFNDNMGLRDFFIRTKNEIDYSIFRSSSRVYYGDDNYIYGRRLIDNEIPATEKMMINAEDKNSIIYGMARFSEDLSEQGITTFFVTPMQKEYFIKNRLPFFAPKVSQSSNFMQFYHQMINEKKINSIDVFSLIKAIPEKYPTFYTQDFHWTHISAFFISREIVNKISNIERSKLKWDDNLEVIYRPFVGSDARFSSRLISNEYVYEPDVKKNWLEIHKIHNLKDIRDGVEFETDLLKNNGLLPEICMFGNSFSDGMLDVGIVNYFSKFTKLDRNIDVLKIKNLIKGKCKYLIFQVLDIQPNVWLSFKALGKE